MERNPKQLGGWELKFLKKICFGTCIIESKGPLKWLGVITCLPCEKIFSNVGVISENRKRSITKILARYIKWANP